MAKLMSAQKMRFAAVEVVFRRVLPPDADVLRSGANDQVEFGWLPANPWPWLCWWRL